MSGVTHSEAVALIASYLREQGWLPTEEAASLRSRAEAAEAREAALRYQIERGGCAVSLVGENTLNCSVERICGLCRLRLRVEAAERERNEAEAARLDWMAAARKMTERQSRSESRSSELEGALREVLGVLDVIVQDELGWGPEHFKPNETQALARARALLPSTTTEDR